MKHLGLRGLFACVAILGVPSTAAGQDTGVRYRLMPTSNSEVAWRIDTYTGQVSRCVVSDADTAPVCGPWSVEGEGVSELAVVSDEVHGEPDFGCSWSANVSTSELPALERVFPITDPQTYFSSAIGRRGSALRSQLSTVVSTDVVRLSYDDAWAALSSTDANPCDQSEVVLLYTGRTQPATSRNRGGRGQNDNWTREHVWPKSHGFRPASEPAYTDLHHLRPADTTVNSSRGDKDFGEGGQPQGEAPNTYRTAQTWEPRPEVQGDIARMMFYMVIRYENSPDLELVSGNTSSDQPRLGDLCTLYQWHQEDPPNEWERRRNNLIQYWQGNRNPFIDYPEWVSSIWSSDCSG